MDNSSFARLSREMCNLIYTFALKNDTPFELTVHSSDIAAPTEPSDSVENESDAVGSSKLQLDRDTADTHPTALLQTCKELQQHTTELFYFINDFTVRADTSKLLPELVSNFLKSIGERSVAALQGIAIQPPYPFHASCRPLSTRHTDDAFDEVSRSASREIVNICDTAMFWVYYDIGLAVICEGTNLYFDVFSFLADDENLKAVSIMRKKFKEVDSVGPAMVPYECKEVMLELLGSWKDHCQLLAPADISGADNEA